MPGSFRPGPLSAAHQGYQYQDALTAYVLVRSIVEDFDEVIVDRKMFFGDRLDDLETKQLGRRIRRQIKTSPSSNRVIGESDFTSDRVNLRFDKLVLTLTSSGGQVADEYRLCATWGPPTRDDRLHDFLIPASAPATIKGTQPVFFKIDVDKIWPIAGSPSWSCLRPPTSSLARTDVASFCEKFILELGLPEATNNLAAPGILERALITELEDRVGIGRFPNENRNPIDVAALAIDLAAKARTNGATLLQEDVLRELAIRTNFGRITQAFPFIESQFQDRPTFRKLIEDESMSSQLLFVLGSPGAGKSWELTQLGRDLAEQGVIVARHYCYLEPGDELVERRVTSNVFFGNLLGELCEAAPSLNANGVRRFSAGIEDLEELLKRSQDLGFQVVLIVDGLDHISRVRAASRNLSEDDTDIIDQLATLSIPPNVSIVIGSQPGPHLDPLRVAWSTRVKSFDVPRWSDSEVIALVDRLGATHSIHMSGITDSEEVNRILTSLALKADGNPLYATYLSRTLVAAIESGESGSPEDWIRQNPPLNGNIANYYQHLYFSASKEAQSIADLVGVIDFSVSEKDIREMVPPLFGAWVPNALKVLSPVLTQVVGQGGVRVFHESFRRFMNDTLASQGRSIGNVLEPVISWLKHRGFYTDSRSYRFLLPCLRRAGLEGEISALVDRNFVSNTLANGHPQEVALKNLAIAGDAATSVFNWPALVRYVELRRAAENGFDADLHGISGQYWKTFLHLYGSAETAERLLFEGKPTQSKDVGLQICSLIDDAGGVAPWQEYLKIPTTPNEDRRDEWDPEGSLLSVELRSLAVIHGNLRIGKTLSILRRVLRHFLENEDDISPIFASAVCSRLAKSGGMNLAIKFVSWSDRLADGQHILPSGIRAAIRIGLSEEYVRLGDQRSAAEHANEALQLVDSPELAIKCITLGANRTFSPSFEIRPGDYPIGVSERLSKARPLRNWIACLRLSSDRPEILEGERRRIHGIGWYRCWLRFCIELSEFENRRKSGLPASIRPAFEQLTVDVRAFAGEPRPCDLFPIRRVVLESITWSLTLIDEDGDWEFSLDSLIKAALGTGSRLDKEDGGPIPIGFLIEAFSIYAQKPIIGPIVSNRMGLLTKRFNAIGTYYSSHAETAMVLAEATMRGGDRNKALDLWKFSSSCLCAYGWRKDITVFEAIASAPYLKPISMTHALSALAKTQVLANTVVAHTDGRETKHAPNRWFRSVLDVDPSIAIRLLAETLSEEDFVEGWRSDRALWASIEKAGDAGHPVLASVLAALVHFDPDDDGEGERLAAKRAVPLERLVGRNKELAIQEIRIFAGEVNGDGRRHSQKAAVKMQEAFLGLNVPVPRQVPIQIGRQYPENSTGISPASRERRAKDFTFPPFPENPSLVDIFAGLRRYSEKVRGSDGQVWHPIISSLGYLLPDLIQQGRENEVFRVLRFFARDVYVSATGEQHPLSQLGEILEGCGYAKIAAFAFTLAYMKSRGGGGYFKIGDNTHRVLFTRALALDRDVSIRILAEEVSFAIGDEWLGHGISRYLVHRLVDIGELESALSAWEELYTVIRDRLPLPVENGWFSRLNPDEDKLWTLDESIVAVILARTGNPILARKISALHGLTQAIRSCENSVIVPLRWWLTRNAPITSVLIVMQTLSEAEAPPFSISSGIQDILKEYSRCDIWGIRILSALLLRRIGIEPPATYPLSAINEPITPIDPARRRFLEVAVDGNILERLEEIFPSITERVLSRLDASISFEGTDRDRPHERFKLRFGRDGDVRPATPVLMWESEVFSRILHQELNGLSAQLWSRGNWEQGIEERVLRDILPNLKLYLGIHASKSPRPNWNLPGQVTNGEMPFEKVDVNDSQFEGWYRIGWTEKNYILDQDNPHMPPKQIGVVYAAAVALPLGQSSPPGAIPFQQGDPDDWWQDPPILRRFPFAFPIGCLIKLARCESILGDKLILVPPLELRRRLGLIPPKIGDALRWSDSTGLPALVFRTWRIRNPESYFAEPDFLTGSDLIIRPDIFDQWIRMLGVNPKDLCAARVMSLSDIEGD